MEDQQFIDIELKESESLANMLGELLNQKREETGSYNIFVQNVIPVGQNHFTVILNTVVTGY
ncbi:hypothetical protein [Lentibacillus cibarius]|uniref:Uncharacterized protein n=1 Tax=Lentibacillus cibarius TaxID=2583219 RepID=A0A5S3QMN9_9BACI|nr:hypothetical protein [Lentibacillus cibarius]TMN23049.1 hypothetical protein FFL34_13870 [Lentibacillus cibarius]